MAHSLVGIRVRHGNLVGVVVSVGADSVLVRSDANPGMVIAVPIPEHLKEGPHA